jgi:nicotinamidase-related amidase
MLPAASRKRRASMIWHGACVAVPVPVPFARRGMTQVELGPSPQNAWRVSDVEADLVRCPLAPLVAMIAAEPQRVRLDLRRSACVVIDMQNDFCAPDGWLHHIGVDIAPARRPIAPLQLLLPRLRQVQVPVIWLNWGNRPDRLNLSPSLLHVYKPNGRGVGLGDKLPGSGAPVLQKDSWAAAIVDELVPAEGDIHVDKYRMSGFWDTPLDSILRNLGVTTMLFAGVNLDQCVMCTLQDANFLGYDCILIEDCAATTSPEFCRDATLYNVKQCFGFVTASTAIEDALAQIA